MSPLFGALIALIALYLLGPGPGSWWTRQWESVRRLLSGDCRADAVRFVDGPLVDTVARLAVGADGLPPLQICAEVRRDAKQGGGYTLPYRRDVFSEDARAWLYRQGWQVEGRADRCDNTMAAHAHATPSHPVTGRAGDHSRGPRAVIGRFTNHTPTDRVDGG